MSSSSEPFFPTSFFSLFNSHITTTPNLLNQISPEDFVLDIQNLNPKFFTCSYYLIDNLNLHVFRPKPGFQLHTLRDGDQLICPGRLFKIRRAIRIYYANDSFILCLITPNGDVYYFKKDSKWHEIDYIEYLDRLKEARSVLPIKEISIDTSSLITRNGLSIGGYKYGSTYQFWYKPDSFHEARSVRYGDDVIWKAGDDTQRCIKATIFLKNYNPVGMTALIFVDEVQIVYYKFENNKWTNIDEENYMKMVLSYKPFFGDFDVRNHEHHYELLIHLCPRVSPELGYRKISNASTTDTVTNLSED